MKRPNILLICTDQMRGDCLGIAGHPVVETPHLDTMAVKGVRFANAYSAVPTCIAARTAIFTGLSQRSHGRVGYQDGIDWNYEHTLAGEFASAGYHTQSVGKMHVHPQRNLCGFHNVILHDGYVHYYRRSSLRHDDNQHATDDYIQWLRERKGAGADIYDTGINSNSWVARPWIYSEELHPTNWVVTQCIDFFRRKDPTKPFFLMASFVRPHPPLDPPRFYYDMYMDQDIPLGPVGDWADTEDPESRGRIYDCDRGLVDPKALKRQRAAYYGCITHIDHQLYRLHQAMFEYGLLENTIVMFISDHGEMLGDHNIFRKSLPYRGSANIPFIIYDPGNILGIDKGRTIDNVVELRDVMPTLLDIAGIPVPDCVEGKSVLPLLRGNQVKWREYIHGEHPCGNYSNHFIVTEKDKYIWFSQTGKEQYFDLESDPYEMHNLIDKPECQERISVLRSALIKELEGREEGYSDGTQLIAGCKPVNFLKAVLNKDGTK